jgi:electron transport complex protein RnfD
MWTVAMALLPALAAGVYVFGWRVLHVTALTVVACVVTEAVIQRLRGLPITIGDGSAVVTGVLLAFVLPPNVRWYVPVAGAVVAIGIAKQAFGGLGANFFNPALVARAFLQFAFPRQVSLAKWPLVRADGDYGWSGLGRVLRDASPGAPDAVTRATPLGLLQNNPGTPWAEMARIPGHSAFGPPAVFTLPTAAAIVIFALLVLAAGAGIYLAVTRRTQFARLTAVAGVASLVLLGVVPTGNVAYGMVGGCIGETSVMALVLGGAILVYYRCIDWRLPVAYIATVAALVMILPVTAKASIGGVEQTALSFGFADPERVLVHVFGGGLFLGAVFMITDMVTSPLTAKGQVIFGIFAGVMVVLIRLYGSFPEGVCYSILLANAVRPLIDRYTVPKVFGARKPEPRAAS